MMIVIMTILNDRPVKIRAQVQRAHSRRTARPPSGKNFKFREPFAAAARIHPLEKTPVAPFEITQVASKEMVNKLTN